jgi:hypothetical protein
MRNNLVKQGDRWVLYDEDGSKIALSTESPFKKLSIKNCQAIECGYDLDELAEKHYGVHVKQGHTEEDSLQRKIDFILGFVSALEILGDKKFSEDDLRLAMHFGKFGETNNQTTTIGFIKSLQQTEFDVEIEMENSLSNGYKNQPDNIIGFIAEYKSVPKLDADGCLILKRRYEK